MGGEGWVKLHRKFAEWEWYKTPNMVHLFLHIILSANHDDGKWQGIEVKRGQLITGRKTLSEKTGISEQSVRTCISKLKLTKEVAIISTKHFSIITVCKYNEYQEQEKVSQPTTNQQLTNDQPTANHKQEEEECKKEKNKDKSIVDKSTRPTIEMVADYCLERGGLVDPQKWFDHYSANGWRVGRNPMKDWRAAVRTWEKNGFSKEEQNKKPMSLKEQYALELMGISQ